MEKIFAYKKNGIRPLAKCFIMYHFHVGASQNNTMHNGANIKWSVVLGMPR